MDIKIFRGDTNLITFGIKQEDDNDFIMSDQDKLYFTVKKSCLAEECIIQKTWGNGITYNKKTKEYEIMLDQDCTCDLTDRPYCYDIELIVNREQPKVVKTLAKGDFIIDMDVTHKENEI